MKEEIQSSGAAVLVVEDDARVAGSLQRGLGEAGFVVATADRLAAADEQLARGTPALVVLDLNLPDGDGREWLRQVRHAGHRMPVIILTARGNWEERVEGINAGADDYLGKPFHVEELLARIQALLRRAAPVPDTELRAGDWRLDEARQCLVDRAGNEQALTATEFRLLRYFMRHPDEVLSKTRLSEHVYDYDAERDSNVIEVYVRRLRGLLGNERIETRRGQGYVFRSGD